MLRDALFGTVRTRNLLRRLLINRLFRRVDRFRLGFFVFFRRFCSRGLFRPLFCGVVLAEYALSRRCQLGELRFCLCFRYGLGFYGGFGDGGRGFSDGRDDLCGFRHA